MVDSCAIQGHQMMEKFLRDRLHMADVMVAPTQLARGALCSPEAWKYGVGRAEFRP